MHSELVIDASLIGQTVRNAARAEWGDGKVLRIEQAEYEGKPAQRVTVQFRIGSRALLVPPARLARPNDEPQRESGWLDQLSGKTLDDRLRSLPERVTDVLGSLESRVRAVLSLYDFQDNPSSIQTWATRQTDLPDPLAQWNRDELQQAFFAFRAERDALLRSLVAQLKQKEGPQVVDHVLTLAEPTQREEVRTALRRVI